MERTLLVNIINQWMRFWSHILPATKYDLLQFENIYMSNQTDLATRITAVSAQVADVASKIPTLSDTVSPELTAAVTGLETAVAALAAAVTPPAS